MSSTEAQAAAPPTSDGNPEAIPSQGTRDFATNYIIKNLTSESYLSRRYGTVPHDVAAELAKKAEEEAFPNFNVNHEDDDIERLKAYGMEIGNRMIDAAKSRSPTNQRTICIPSQRTRDRTTNYIIKTLTSESVLSRRHGTVPHDVAAELAKKVEEEAFSNANVNHEDDDIERFKAYGMEIRKWIIDAAKSRSPPPDAAPAAPVEE